MQKEKISVGLQNEQAENEQMQSGQPEKEKNEGIPNEVKQNKGNRLRGRLMAAAGSLLCFMLFIGLLMDLLFDCMMTNTVGVVFWNNPYRMHQSVQFEETREYGQMLYQDMLRLSHYLAVCSQLESNGSFDANKTVDIVSYAYRKEKEIPDYLKGIQIEYRVGDLIEWAGDGISFHDASESEKQSIAEKYQAESFNSEYSVDEAMEEYLENHISVEDVEETAEDVVISSADEAEITTEIAESEETLTDGGQNTAAQYAGFDSRYILTEQYWPVGKKSLYDVVLPENVTYYEIACLVMEAANDLYSNYSLYQELHDVFGTECNLKYVMRSSDNSVMYTNLKDAETFKTQRKELSKCNSYLIYDYEENTIESKNIGQLDEFEIKGIFREFAYLYPDGATVCVALQDASMNTAYWGKFNTLDGYARARKTYQNASGAVMQQTVMMIALFLLTVFLFILFSVLQPRKKAEQMRGFDRLFTGIALGLAVVVEIGLLVLGVFIADAFLYDASYALEGFLHKEELFMLLMLIAFVMYVLLLFFWGSFIRRCKAHTLWSGGLIYSTFTKIKKYFWNICGIILNDRNFIIRVALPYMIYVCLSIFLVVAGAGVGVVVVILLNAVMIYFLYYQNQCRNSILEGITRICEGDIAYQIPTEKLVGDNKILAQNINTIGNTIERAVKTSLKDEKLKADLITNVSHDIKTPLTSIINYVDLLKKENIPGEQAQRYVQILDEKSQRLKQLILDLVEASKISSGNIEIEKTKLDMTELMQQAIGEYEEKLKSKNLAIVTNFKGEKGDMVILADSRHMWRVFDNLFGNISKYAMAGTRVYLDMEPDDKKENLILEIKNISEKPLQVPVEDLTRRFVRGDEARNTEGSGLGLSIAQTLTQALGGTFQISLDGDLFKVTICFPRYKETDRGNAMVL